LRFDIANIRTIGITLKAVSTMKISQKFRMNNFKKDGIDLQALNSVKLLLKSLNMK